MFDGFGRPTRTLGILAVVVLVGTAGCAGFLGGDQSTPTPATPTDGATATTDADETTVSGIDLPRGVSENGSVDPRAVVFGHDEALSGTAYTTHLQINRSVGPRTSSAVQVNSVGSDGTYLSRFSKQGAASLTQITWGNESVAVSRVEAGQQVRYRRQDASDVRRNLSGRAFLVQFASLGDYSVESVDRSSGEIVLRADGPTEDATVGGNSKVSAYSGRMVLDDEGRIRRLNVTLELAVGSGQTATVTVAFGLSDVGETTVQQPGWVSNALAKGSLVAPAIAGL